MARSGSPSSGFTIDGLGSDGTADNGAAVALEFFHSSGTIQSNTIRNWHTLDFATSANGLNAIHLINGEGESVKVVNNTITQFQTTAILGEGASTLKISGNDITTPSTPANTITHFSDPVSHTPEANGIISRVFEPNHIVP